MITRHVRRLGVQTKVPPESPVRLLLVRVIESRREECREVVQLEQEGSFYSRNICLSTMENGRPLDETVIVHSTQLGISNPIGHQPRLRLILQSIDGPGEEVEMG